MYTTTIQNNNLILNFSDFYGGNVNLGAFEKSKLNNVIFFCLFPINIYTKTFAGTKRLKM